MYSNWVGRSVCSGALMVAFFVGCAGAMAEGAKEATGYSKQGFLDAALTNCIETENRPPKSCKCEQMLIDSDRLTDDEKEMAFYFWTDRPEFVKRFEARKAQDPEWPAKFSQKFTNLQALIVSACGR